MTKKAALCLSEIMLQQTTVPHGTPYWRKFLEAFPTVTNLANAERDVVLGMWAGLGYYARARNLHKCAQIIRDQHGGAFPQTEAALLKLPGIGPYTAATIAAICFDEATNIVDGNVERVISRIFTVEEPLPKGRKELRRLAGTLYGACFIAESDGHYLIETRPEKGLLGGMIGFPGTDWTSEIPPEPISYAPFKANWEDCTVVVKHVFTHFELRLSVFQARIDKAGSNQLWGDEATLKGLPTVFKKALKATQV